MEQENKIICMDCIEGMKQLPDKCVQLVVTSPPYNRTYRKDAILYESYDDNMPEEEYIEWQYNVFKEIYRILKDDGVVIWNFGYGTRTIDLPYKLVMKFQETGLKLFETIIWEKPNSMPVTHLNFLTRRFEFIWLFAKNRNFFMDKSKETLLSLREYFGNNIVTNMWKFNIHFENQFSKVKCGSDDADVYHGAVFPIHLPKIAILLYTKPGDIVLDPFMGTGTSALAAKINGRKHIGYDIDPKYVELANSRLNYKTIFEFGGDKQ